MELHHITNLAACTGDEETDYDLRKLKSLSLAATAYSETRATRMYQQALERAFWLRQLFPMVEEVDVVA